MRVSKFSTGFLSLVCCLGAGVAHAQVDADASALAARAVASALASAEEGELLDELTAESYDAIARDLAARIEAIEKARGHVSRDLLVPMVELAKLHVAAGQSQNAIPLLRDVISLLQQLDGVLSPSQLPVYELLIECYVSRDLLADLKRAQGQVLLINENAVGKQDERMIPVLLHAGAWYEEAGDYENARDAHSRAMSLARKLGGENGPRLIDPLRAMARTFRLQMQYESEPWRGRALDGQAQRLLERAARIARDAPGVDARLKIDTLLELGDSWQIAGAARDAIRTYREVWQSGGEDSLREPQPVFYRAAVGVALRRPPLAREKLEHYWIDFTFTVTKLGHVEDLRVQEASAPKHLHAGIAENIRRTPFRPRFEAGEPVDTAGVNIRQGIWVDP